jgi:hypothetical protein
MPSRAETIAPGLGRLVHNVYSRPTVYNRCPPRASLSGIRAPPEGTEARHHDVYPLRPPGVPINVFALLSQRTLFPPLVQEKSVDSPSNGWSFNLKAAAAPGHEKLKINILIRTKRIGLGAH